MRRDIANELVVRLIYYQLKQRLASSDIARSPLNSPAHNVVPTPSVVIPSVSRDRWKSRKHAQHADRTSDSVRRRIEFGPLSSISSNRLMPPGCSSRQRPACPPPLISSTSLRMTSDANVLPPGLSTRNTTALTESHHSSPCAAKRAIESPPIVPGGLLPF